MPRIKSAKKRMRQARAHAARNRTQRSELRTVIKKVRAAGEQSSKLAAFEAAEKVIDRAGRKRLIHPNAAGRLKSRLRKLAAG